MQVFLLFSLTESTDRLGGTEEGGFVGLEGLALSAEFQGWFCRTGPDGCGGCGFWHCRRQGRQTILQSCRQRSAVGPTLHFFCSTLHQDQNILLNQSNCLGVWNLLTIEPISRKPCTARHLHLIPLDLKQQTKPWQLLQNVRMLPRMNCVDPL